MQLDKDLQSIQATRDIIKKAKEAQKQLANSSQAEIDKLTFELAKSAEENAVRLAELAVEETTYGNVKDKITKNVFASRVIYEYIKDMKTVGVINEDEEKGIIEIGVPVGVIAGLVPSTNPTSTAIYKSIISIKSGNAIILSPHPSALKCIGETVEVLRATLKKNGYDEDLISMLPIPTMEATDTLMKHDDVSLILATGGSAMVKAAYSSGTPALGVGPGNVPVFIEKSADIKDAVSKIIKGKTFDNGVICASEQAIVVEKAIADEVRAELVKQGCYFVNEQEKKAMEKIIDNKKGGLNAKIVGQSVQKLAQMAGIEVPGNIKVIIAEETKVGAGYPFSREKLSPLLAFYVHENWEDACERCIELLNYGGIGHSLGIHSKNKDIIMQFGLKKPVSRFLVNTPTTQGGIGATTGIAPALTLGCGAVGGSATSDNVTPLNLINKRRIAYQVKEAKDLKPSMMKSQENNNEDMIQRILNAVMKELSEN